MRITRAQALQIARVAFSTSKPWVEDRGARSASTPEQRKAALKELHEMREKKPVMVSIFDQGYSDEMTLGEFRNAWRERTAAVTAWRTREQELQGICWRRRYAVGAIGALAIGVRGHGDSWEDAFKQAGVTSEKIEQILKPRRAAAKRAVAQLEAQASADE
jgi:hypothetical protein